MLTDDDIEDLISYLCKSPSMGKQILKHLLRSQGKIEKFEGVDSRLPYRVEQKDAECYEIVGYSVIAKAFTQCDADLICMLLNSNFKVQE